MVKNKTGGNKSKGLARKNFARKDSSLRMANEEGEIYAQAIKVMGGNIASAIDLNGNSLRVHIRGKFRGRGKRDNFIGPNTWLLVGLHDWQSDKSRMKPDAIKDCDILEVYSESDKTRLKNSVTDINWNTFITNDNKSFSTDKGNTNEDLGFNFMDAVTQEYEDIIATSSKTNPNSITEFIIKDDIEINVDDI